jgi:hypothetical protein
MCGDDTAPAPENALDDEYAELRRRITDGGWNPGDMFRTSTGTKWQFRTAPYTADFPGIYERQASGQANTDAFRPRAAQRSAPLGTR